MLVTGIHCTMWWVWETHLSVKLPQSVSISGAEINLTLRAVTTYVLCCNLAPSISALKMCIFSNNVMKWHDFCCGQKGFIFSGKIWWQLFSCNKACSKYHTRSTTTPKYTLAQLLVLSTCEMPSSHHHVISSISTGYPHNIYVTDCYFIVNVLDLPFASPRAIYR